nr:ribonuclease H-like domain-containing protein [Tanacetum cinerariifolium]
MAIDYAAGGILRKLRSEVAWETIEDLAQYEEEGWNDHVVPEGESSTVVPEQEALLPHAFSGMTIQDHNADAWNMDTCASSHLNDSITSVSDVLNMCIYPLVSLGKHVRLPFSSSYTFVKSLFLVGSIRPLERLNLHVSTTSPLPKSHVDAFNDPNWQNAINDEYNALIKNNTWTLVPRPVDANVVYCIVTTIYWFFA